MNRALVALLFVAAMAGCAFDRSGLGNRGADDGGAGAPIDAPGSGTGSGTGTGGSTPDAKPQPTPPDANTTPDANTHAGVGCDNQTCAVGEVCCVSLSPGGGAHYTCDDKCGNNEASFACDGPEDCSNGDSCCFTQLGSRCSKSCSPQQQVTCREASDCPTGFGGKPQTCCPSQFPTVDLCQDVCF